MGPPWKFDVDSAACDSMAGPRLMAILSSQSYGFGETRVARLALLTFTAPSASSSDGVVITRFSGHAATFRSNGLCRDLDAGFHLDPHLIWHATKSNVRASMFFGLYRMRAFSVSGSPRLFQQHVISNVAGIHHRVSDIK